MIAAPYNMRGNHISKSCQKCAIARKNATAAQKACNCGIFSADSDRADRDITQKAQCEVARFSRTIGIFCNAGRNAAANRQQSEVSPHAGKKPIARYSARCFERRWQHLRFGCLASSVRRCDGCGIARSRGSCFGCCMFKFFARMRRLFMRTNMKTMG